MVRRRWPIPAVTHGEDCPGTGRDDVQDVTGPSAEDAMMTGRRNLPQLAATGVALAAGPGREAAAQPSPRLEAFAFDAYGTLFDVHSVAALAEELFPGRGDAVSQLWRTKQIEYTWLRTMAGPDAYRTFWEVTEDGLVSRPGGWAWSSRRRSGGR
jgi:hypothetical protein